MASIEKRKGKYRIRWRDPDGVQRSRTVPDYDTARRVAREIEQVTSAGRRWEPCDGNAIPRVADAFADYLEWAENHFAPNTVRQYSTCLHQFLDWLESDTRRRKPTLDLVTNRRADSWYHFLRHERGLKTSTANLRAVALQSCRTWLYDDEDYHDVTPAPRRRLRLATVPHQPPAAPSWDDMDKAIHAAIHQANNAKHWKVKWNARARVQAFTVLRFTGLRIEQVMQLRWEDFDLDERWLKVRGELGKSRQEKAGRVIPVSEHLVAELATWGTREGWLVDPDRSRRVLHTNGSRVIWELTDVDPRRYKSPHHSFRHGFKSNLLAAGASKPALDYLVGHNMKGTDGHYLDPRTALDMVSAVKLIPAVSQAAKVVRFRSNG